MVKRFLITTADERTWKFDRPVLFMNEWCRLYDRKSVYEAMEEVVADTNESSAEQQKKNIAYVQELTGRLLIELSTVLNSLHNTNHSLRYWNILIGHWLERYVFIIFDRYSSLDHILTNYEVDSTIALDDCEYSLATSDSLSAIWACNDNTWNHVLCSRILRFIGGIKIESKPMQAETEQRFIMNKETNASMMHKVLNIIAEYITPKFKRENDAFISNTYLPKWLEVKLQLALGQCPQYWQSPSLQTEILNKSLRQTLRIGDNKLSGFEHFLRIQLPEMIPICYLEGYSELCNHVDKLSWPRFPKFIYTSNRFDTDEIFKAWAGSMVDKGVPYFVGQHGANYGTFVASDKFPVAITCDKFFTWGWTHDNPKNVPAFVFKTAKKNLTCNTKDGGLLLIELPPLHRFGLADINASYNDFSKYQDEQFQFVAALPKNVQESLTVRLHGEWRKHCWSDKARWNDRHPLIDIEPGTAQLETLIAKSRLVIHSYNSTGTLETLALNIPTMCFWYDGLDHISEKAKPYYELLRDVGIFHDNPNQAAESIAFHWDNVDAWWASERVQHAREVFCNEYARTEKHPVKKLKQLLSEAVLSHDDQTNIRRSKSSSN